MSDSEWGPWVDHDGKGCPVIGRLVQVRLSGYSSVIEIVAGDEARAAGVCVNTSPDSAWEGERWQTRFRHGFVLKYRVKKPRGMKILEGILAGVKDKELELA